MRVLFAGGTGFIGKTFLESLGELQASRPFELTVLSRSPDAFLRDNPELTGDLGRRFSLVRQSLPEISLTAPFDVIIHGAEVPLVNLGDDYVSRSAEVLQSLLSFAERAGTRQIVYLSSGAVYTLAKELSPPFEVSTNLRDSAPEAGAYAYSKHMSEETLRRFSQQTGIGHAVIRIFNVASRHVPLSGRYALGNFVGDLLSPDQPAIMINGSGKDRRSFIGGRQLSGLLDFCLDQAPPGAVYNACSRDSVSILELAELVREAAASDKPVAIASPEATANDYFGAPNLPEAFLSSAADIRAEIAALLSFSASKAGV